MSPELQPQPSAHTFLYTSMFPLAWQARNWLPLLRGTNSTALTLLES